MLRLLGKNSIKLSKNQYTLTNALRYQSTFNKNVLIGSASKYHKDHAAPTFNEELAEIKHLKKFKVYSDEVINAFSNVDKLEGDLQKQATLTSLYHRLRFNEYPDSIKYTDIATCLNCAESEVPGYNNSKLKSLGYKALKANVLTRLYIKYPRLPSIIADALIEQLLSVKNLHNIGLSQFGLEVNKQTLLEAYLANEDVLEYFGKVSSLENFINRKTANGITEVVNSNITGEKVPIEYRPVSDATLALFGLMNQKVPNLFELFARDFLNVEELEIQKVFLLNDSENTLNDILSVENIPKVAYKLLAETGRDSAEPMFIVGVFTAEGEKLGEGFGSNVQDARSRAALDACIKYFCYSPTLKNGDIAFGKGEIISELL
ncbi:unnamed protein product [Hanseniaspora opuntiae]